MEKWCGSFQLPGRKHLELRYSFLKESDNGTPITVYPEGITFYNEGLLQRCYPGNPDAKIYAP